MKAFVYANRRKWEIINELIITVDLEYKSIMETKEYQKDFGAIIKIIIQFAGNRLHETGFAASPGESDSGDSGKCKETGRSGKGGKMNG